MVIARKIGACIATAGLLTAVLAMGGQAAADGSRKAKAQPAQDTASGIWFGGFDAAKDATYSFDGVIVAFNRDISKDGWALRAYGSRVDFDQEPTGDGRGWQGDVMLGYLFHRMGYSGGIYTGADYENYKLSPDDLNSPVRGTEWGFKVAGDVATSDRPAPAPLVRRQLLDGVRQLLDARQGRAQPQSHHLRHRRPGVRQRRLQRAAAGRLPHV